MRIADDESSSFEFKASWESVSTARYRSCLNCSFKKWTIEGVETIGIPSEMIEGSLKGF